MTLLHLVYAYLVGGVTFIPAAIAVFIYLHPKTPAKKPEIPLRATEIEEAQDSGLTAFKQGWIVVTHEELESQDDIAGRSEAVGDSQDLKSAYSSLYKLVTNKKVAVRPESAARPEGAEAQFKEDTFALREAANIVSGETAKSETKPTGEEEEKVRPSAEKGEPLTEIERLGKQGVLDDTPMPSGTPASAPSKKHRYYAVLKHGNLFLYKNERKQDVKHVIVLSNHMVTLWPRNLPEASLFTKYSSIALVKADWSRPRRFSETRDDGSEWHAGKVTTHDVLDPNSGLPAPPGAIFIYTDYNVDKEDWYFALIRATKSSSYAAAALDPAVYAETLHFATANSIKLLQALYSSEGQLQTKWINAILGRLFLSLQQTDVMRNYLVLKIEKKLNKIKTPGFLDKFQIIRVDAGSAAPLISYPVLKEMNPEGNLLVSFDVHYTGGLSMQLATKVTINLGSRFKTREVDVLLSITFDQISGPMLLRMKPPPSTRLWYTFESEPHMSIKIEPVISSRSMSYGVITKSIEKKFKDAIKDSLVFPHWDDIVFYRAQDELYRGGLWDKSARPDQTEAQPKEKPKEQSKEKPKEQSKEQSGLADSGSEKVLEPDDVISEFSSASDEASFSSGTPALAKARLSSTLNDLSKRLRKPKSASTLEVDETSILSDGSEVSASEPAYSGTIRKIGSWYTKPTKAPASPQSPAYVAPEMISNRRPRKQSSATLSSDPERDRSDVPGYDFGSKLFPDDRISKTIDVQVPLSRKPPPDSP